MDATEIFALVRKACADVNIMKQDKKFFNLEESDTELSKAFINFCQTTEDEIVPETVSDAWSKIPTSWEDDVKNIPVVAAPPKRHERGRTAKAVRASKSRGADGKCGLFGKFNATANRCKKCETEHAEEFSNCKKFTEDAKEKAKEAAALKREEAKAKKAAEKAKKAEAAKVEMSPEEKAAISLEKRKTTYATKEHSRYGHRLGTTAALIDDAIFEGIDHESLVRRILETNPDTNEDKARVKIRDHINYLPKKRGIAVTVTRRDNAPDFYKVEAESWCKDPSVEPVKNILDDQRTPRPAVAEKK